MSTEEHGAEATPEVQPAVPTPPQVLAVLSAAFGSEMIGETGYRLAASTCTSDQEKAEARDRGNSLLYGELLPDGVSKMLLPSRLGGSLDRDAAVLELGMGSGKVALQIFLQCPGVARLLGVELVRSRYLIAEAALARLEKAFPQHFRVCSQKPGEMIRLEQGGRQIEFLCNDFFSLGLNLCERSDAIVFAVNIPCKAFPELCNLLSKAKEGCRLFTYHALETIWWTDAPCPFIQVEDNLAESDTFATSWSPQGFRFYVYVCDRQREPVIAAGLRDESFTQWKPIWDEAGEAWYYHNEETEVSQWDVPLEAGAWQVAWSEEHQAHFYCHTPSGHSQWEVPKCLADLGWRTAT